MTMANPDGNTFESAEAQMVEIRKALIAAQEAEDLQLCQRWKESRHEGDRHQYYYCYSSSSSSSLYNQPNHPPPHHHHNNALNPTSTISNHYRRNTKSIRNLNFIPDEYHDDEEDVGDEEEEDDEEHQDEGSEQQEDSTMIKKKKNAKNKKITLDERTVLYHPNGGTPLFKSIEEQNWDLADRLLRDYPEQAHIWVVSTGTVQTTFDWSLWKRLPLHEAVRRQPPRSIILQLLRVYPRAVRERTQFGELSLHLAVECGASIDVIQLLCLYDWELCCTAVDQSGRTVLEILKNSDGNVLDPDDQNAIIDTLTATMTTYEQIQQVHHSDRERLQQQHQTELEQLRLEHQQDLKLAQAKQTKLLATVQSLRETIQQHESTIAQQNESLRDYDELQSVWQHQYETLRRAHSETTTQLLTEQSSTATLVQTIAGRDEHILYLKETIQDLQTAVCRMAGWHDTIVRPQLEILRRQLQVVHHSYGTLQDHLLDHSDDLHTVLKELNIDISSATTYLSSSDGGCPGVTDHDDGHGDATNHNNNTTTSTSTDEDGCGIPGDPHNRCRTEEQDEEPVDDDTAVLRAAQAASHVVLE